MHRRLERVDTTNDADWVADPSAEIGGKPVKGLELFGGRTDLHRRFRPAKLFVRLKRVAESIDENQARISQEGVVVCRREVH
jgi:hypothetical protein